MSNLETVVSQSKVIQDFVKHPGMALLVERLNKKVDLKKMAWLNAATPEEAEIHRQNARAYASLMGMINEFLQQGAQAEKALLASNNQEQSNDQAPKSR